MSLDVSPKNTGASFGESIWNNGMVIQMWWFFFSASCFHRFLILWKLCHFPLKWTILDKFISLASYHEKEGDSPIWPIRSWPGRYSATWIHILVYLVTVIQTGVSTRNMSPAHNFLQCSNECFSCATITCCTSAWVWNNYSGLKEYDTLF